MDRDVSRRSTEHLEWIVGLGTASPGMVEAARRELRRRLEDRECAGCGRPLPLGTRSNARTCSPRCRKIVSRRRAPQRAGPA